MFSNLNKGFICIYGTKLHVTVPLILLELKYRVSVTFGLTIVLAHYVKSNTTHKLSYR